MLNVRQCGCHFIYIIPFHPHNSPYGIDTIIISTSQVRGLWTRGHVTCPKSFIQPVSSRAGALGTSDSEALHLITMQYSLLYSPLSPKHPGCYYNLINATPIITTPNGELWRVILFRNLNTKFLLHRKSTRSEAFRFPPSGSLLWSSYKRTSHLTGLLLPLEKAPQGLMQKRSFALDETPV